MPRIISNARDFLFSTDYPIDKIIDADSGQVTVGAFDAAFPEINHGFTFAPLYILKWSTSPTFDNSFDEIGVSTIDSVQLNGQVNTSKLYLFINNNNGSPVTFYWRVLYFMPPDISLSALPTAKDFEEFNFNTDLNYTKILFEDKTAGGNAVITHGLGYYPQVELWYMRTDGKLIHLADNELTFPFKPTAKITTAQLELNNNGTGVSYWYYRIYADET